LPFELIYETLIGFYSGARIIPRAYKTLETVFTGILEKNHETRLFSIIRESFP